MSDYETILVERKGRVGLVTLNRPKALNALNSQLMDGGRRRASTASTPTPDIGCDRAHRFGEGLRGRRRHQGDAAEDLHATCTPRTGSPRWDRLPSVRTPIVAAVPGYALGGGCELAMLCDFIIAADNAKFGQPEIKLGVIPGIGGSQRLTRAVGKAKAMDLCLTGRIMDAEEAERAGLVARVVPAASCSRRRCEAADDDRRRCRCPSRMMAKEAVEPLLRDRPSPRACGSNGGSSTRLSPPPTRRKAWPPSSRSASRSSSTADGRP